MFPVSVSVLDQSHSEGMMVYALRHLPGYPEVITNALVTHSTLKSIRSEEVLAAVISEYSCI